MGIYAEKKEGDFKQVNPGLYVARCYSMIEIGTVEQDYLGERKNVHLVNITWELPTEKEVFNEEKGEEPFVVSKMYTLSLHEKANLRKDLESWRGKGYTDAETKRFDITKLIGQPCMLNIIHEPSKTDSSKNYVRVASVSPLMKGQTCPDQINPTKLLCFEDFNWEVFDTLPDWMKDKIKSSEEYKMLVEPQAVNTPAEQDDNDMPFN